MSKILIIDDDPDIVTAVHMVLENAGYQVLDAAHENVGVMVIKEVRPILFSIEVMMDTASYG
ncbi:MAG: hypothetical protein P8Y98_03160 [Anaerolineales bacterium]